MFEAHIQSFLKYLQFEKRYSRHTLISYETDLIDFKDYLQIHYGDIDIKSISHIYIRSWLANKKESGISAVTINRKISSLKSFYKFLIRSGVAEASPMIKVISPKKPSKLPVFIRQENVQQIADAVSNTESWKELNASMLVSIFYCTGMRLNELITLKDSQFDHHKKVVRVLGKGNKERVIPVTAELLQRVKDYQLLKKKEIGSETETLLTTEKGKKLYPKYAYLAVKNILGESVKTLDKKSPHVLRHTFATHLANNGADLNAIKELLGHSSLAATQIYTHNTIEKLKDIFKKAHPKSL